MKPFFKHVSFLLVFLLLVLNMPLGITSAQVSDGLVGYWAFDEGSGTYANDSSGNGIGSNIRGNAQWVDGVWNGALSFDGVDDYIVLPLNDALKPADQVSVSAWIKLDGAQGAYTKVIWYGTPDVNPFGAYGLEIWRKDDTSEWRQVAFHISHNGGYTKAVYDTELEYNVWYHITGTYDGQYAKIYVNGELKKAEYASGTIDGYRTTPLAIGAAENGIQKFKGALDEVRIYNRALSQEEIEELSATPLTSTFVCIEDSHIRGSGEQAPDYRNTNFNNEAYLEVKGSYNDSFTREAFLKYDLTGYTDSICSRAILNIYVYDTEGIEIPLTVHGYADDDWSQDTLTWNNQPSAGGSVKIGVIKANGAGWYGLDVTEYVNSQMSDKIVTFRLKDEAKTDKVCKIIKSESGSNMSYIEITNGTPATPAPAATPTPTPAPMPTPTPREGDPVVIWVAPDGDDSNSGLSEDQALRTIQEAANRALAGDLVRIKPGIYNEAVVINNTGTPDNPITFESTERFGAIMTKDVSCLFRSGRDEWERSLARYITIRGIWFKDTPVSDEGSMGPSTIDAADGWVIEDCKFTNCGVGVRYMYSPDDPVENTGIYRTVFEDMKVNSIWSHYKGDVRYHLRNAVVKDTIFRRNNVLNHDPGWHAGANKFLFTKNLLIDGVISYDNNGTGLWLDWDNVDFVVRNSTFFGNHAGECYKNYSDNSYTDAYWAGVGFWTEGNPSGIIENNTFYSNLAAALGVLESGFGKPGDMVNGYETVENEGLTIRGNMFVDNNVNISFRAMNRGEKVLGKANITDNVFKSWKSAAWNTSLNDTINGTSKPSDIGIILDKNIYSPFINNVFGRWVNTQANSFAELQSKYGAETNGKEEYVGFEGTLFNVRSTTLGDVGQASMWQVPSAAAEATTIDDAIAGKAVGQEVTIPVFGRRPITEEGDHWVTYVYDLQARYVKLIINDETTKDYIEQYVNGYATIDKFDLNVILNKKEPYEVVATAVLDTEADLPKPTPTPIGTPTPTPTPSPTPEPPAGPGGLVGHWTFDDEENIGKDSSGLGYDAEVRGAPAIVEGVNGKALSFNGAGDLLYVPLNPSLQQSKEITVAAWIYLNGDQANWTKIVWLGQTATSPWGSYGLEFLPENNTGPKDHITFDVAANNSAVKTTWTTPLEEGRWYHVAGTYDGSKAKLYIDGVLKAVTETSGDIQGYTGHGLGIGGACTNIQFFKGNLDDVRIYNRALAETEIGVLAGIIEPTPTPTPAITVTPSGEKGSKEVLISAAVPAMVDEVGGSAYVAIDGYIITEMLDMAEEIKASKKNPVIEIRLDLEGEAGTVEVTIPRSAFKKVAEADVANFKVDTGIGTISLGKKAINTVNASALAGDVSFSFKKIRKDDLTEVAQGNIGGSPVCDFSIEVGNAEISEFGNDKAEIGIPYTLKYGDNKNNIIVYYISNTGALEIVHGKYDPVTECVKFEVKHF